ncbi:MAG: terminase family protein [Candidatus Anstonellales archaeon]
MNVLNKTVEIHKWQLQHLQSTKRFHILVWHRKARKSFTGLLKLYKEAVSKPGVYWFVSPTFRAAKHTIWEDARMLDTVFDKEIIKKRNQTDLSLQLINDSWIYLYGADEPNYLRGPNPNGVVIDEYAEQKEEVWTQVIAPIIYMNKGWAMFAFTPKGKNHAWKLWKQNEENPDWELSFLPVSKSGLLSSKEIEIIKSSLPASAFEQEFECEFLEGEGTVFRRIYEAIKDLQPNFSAPHIFGLDLGKKIDFTVLIGIDRTTNHVDFIDRFNLIDWDLSRDRIVADLRKFPPSPVVVEANSIGDPYIENLRKFGVSIIPFITSATTKKDIINKLSIFIENKYISYPNNPTILNELSAFGYEITKNGNIKYGAPEGVHDDVVMAMALAVSQISDKPLPKSYTPTYQFNWTPQEKPFTLDPYDE